MIRKACKDEGITVRQFARRMKDQVIDNMLKLGERAAKGNLSRTAQSEIENITTLKEVWASNFQTYNPRCPERVRNWLIKNYESRFGDKDKEKKKT